MDGNRPVMSPARIYASWGSSPDHPATQQPLKTPLALLFSPPRPAASGQAEQGMSNPSATSPRAFAGISPRAAAGVAPFGSIDPRAGGVMMMLPSPRSSSSPRASDMHGGFGPRFDHLAGSEAQRYYPHPVAMGTMGPLGGAAAMGGAGMGYYLPPPPPTSMPPLMHVMMPSPRAGSPRPKAGLPPLPPSEGGGRGRRRGDGGGRGGGRRARYAPLFNFNTLHGGKGCEIGLILEDFSESNSVAPGVAGLSRGLVSFSPIPRCADPFRLLVRVRVEELAPLHEACKHEDVEGMARLLDQDPRRLDSRDGDGMHTPLMVRSHKGQRHIRGVHRQAYTEHAPFMAPPHRQPRTKHRRGTHRPPAGMVSARHLPG